MLRSALELRKYRLDLQDGELGKARDFFFDDQAWTIRYLVADTGKWLPGRRVLIAPASLAPPDWAKHIFPVNLTREQVENSPGVATDQPVSRQLETDLADYFQWPHYWAPTANVMNVYGAATAHPPPPATPEAERAAAARGEKGDPHLRSMLEVKDYHIQARDGEIGHVDDFIIDDQDWVIRYLVIDTRNWLPGQRVLIAPDWFENLDWEESKAFTELDRDTIKDAPGYDPSQPINRDYEGRLYDYYGRPGYWTETAPPVAPWKT